MNSSVTEMKTRSPQLKRHVVGAKKKKKKKKKRSEFQMQMALETQT